MAGGLMEFINGGLIGSVDEQSAPTIDTSKTDAALQAMGGGPAGAEQQQAIGLTQQMAQGRGPSAATALLKQQTEQGIANTNALASSGSGSSGQGLARRQAMLQGANMMQNLGGQAAAARAQEQMGAVGSLGQQTTAARGQDIQAGLGAAGINAGLATSQANIQEQQNQANQQAQEANQKAAGNILGDVAGAAAGLAMFSSPAGKTDIKDAGDPTAGDHPFTTATRAKYGDLYNVPFASYSAMGGLSSPPTAKEDVQSADNDWQGAMEGMAYPSEYRDAFKSNNDVGMQTGGGAAPKGAADSGINPWSAALAGFATQGKSVAPMAKVMREGSTQMGADAKGGGRYPDFLNDFVSQYSSFSSPPQAKTSVKPAEKKEAPKEETPAPQPQAQPAPVTWGGQTTPPEMRPGVVYPTHGEGVLPMHRGSSTEPPAATVEGGLEVLTTRGGYVMPHQLKDVPVVDPEQEAMYRQMVRDSAAQHHVLEDTVQKHPSQFDVFQKPAYDVQSFDKAQYARAHPMPARRPQPTHQMSAEAFSSPPAAKHNISQAEHDYARMTLLRPADVMQAEKQHYLQGVQDRANSTHSSKPEGYKIPIPKDYTESAQEAPPEPKEGDIIAQAHSSSPKQKKDVSGGDIGGALRGLHPYSYSYKDAGHEPIPQPTGGERFFGVMTTDLKKNPTTKNMVFGHGAEEKVSVPAATSFNLASSAHLQRTSDDHESRLGALEKMFRSSAAKKGKKRVK